MNSETSSDIVTESNYSVPPAQSQVSTDKLPTDDVTPTVPISGPNDSNTIVFDPANVESITTSVTSVISVPFSPSTTSASLPVSTPSVSPISAPVSVTPVTPVSVVPATTVTTGSSVTDTTNTCGQPSVTKVPSDLKVIYVNKSSDGESKTSMPIPLSNGIGTKMVHLPNTASGPGGITYFGTIIKSAKEGSTEGQKVLLTPVIKDGARFIVPKGNSSVPPRAQVPKVVGVANAVQSTGQIILSSSNLPRRSFLIHNSNINKDLKNLGVNTIVPKVLPPATKVPLVISPSRSHPDVTLTSVKSVPQLQPVDVSDLSSTQLDAALSGQPGIPASHKVVNLTEKVAESKTPEKSESSEKIETHKPDSIKNLEKSTEETAEGKKIKLFNSNGHFVRILSGGTNANSENGFIIDKDCKNILVKEIKKEDGENTGTQAKPVQINIGINQMQRSFPLKIAPMPSITDLTSDAAKKTSPTSASSPASTLSVGGLQVKELSKESVMIERSRKRKGAPILRDCFKKTIAVKRLEPLTGAGSYDPLKVIDWNQNTCIGNLPGSDVKFIVNKWGAIQVYEGDGSNKNTNNKSLGGMDVIYCPGDSSGKDEIGRCIECECYGLLIEFIEEKFCSTACRERSQMRNALYTKRALTCKENTNKKRKLFEIALNKNRPEDKYKNKENKMDEDGDSNPSVDSEDMSVPTTGANSTGSYSTVNATSGSGKGVKAIELNKALAKVMQIETAKQNNEKKIIKQVPEPQSSTTSANDTKKKEEEFDWSEYLGQMRSHPAWIRLFKDAFPSQPNLFKVGHRLEAIDPQRPSLFCAAHVTQVKGYRIKLNFDGYPKTYDFWVNADSPNIFPCGFCSSHGIELEPPWGCNKQTFTWPNYLNHIKAKAAPPKCFIHKQVDSGEPNLFKVGMKVEAVDKKNSYLVCVATVSAVVDHRLLIHFDSWDDTFDYWCEYYSPNIHPVEWCQRNNYMLTPPKGVKKKNFSWKKYLQDTNSEAAPVAAFMVRPPIKFKKGSKLEAIDPRAPHLLRVATIKQVLPYQVHVVFDGFPDHFGSWFDDDSPDLHPIGWGKRTGHPLTPPPKLCDERVCGTGGCMGDGNASSGDQETHDNTNDCPYSHDNLDDDSLLPDRLTTCNKNWSNKPLSEVKKDLSQIQRNRKLRESVDMASSNEPADNSCSTNVASNSNTGSSLAHTSNSITSSTIGSSATLPSDNQSNTVPASTNSIPVPVAPESMQTCVNSNFTNVATSPIKIDSENNCDSNHIPKNKGEIELDAACDKFIAQSVPCCSEITEQDLLEWDCRKVTSFIESILHKATNSFYNNKVDGEGLLMLTEEDLFHKLQFNQSEASLIYNSISQLRVKFNIQI